MEILRIDKLGRHSIARTAGTELYAGCCALAVRVATLYHKVLDYTMEECAVVIAFLSKFDEIITMKRGLVIEADCNIAERSLDLYF